MGNIPPNVASYLKKHFNKNYNVEWNNRIGIDHIIVIPAIAEFKNIKKLLRLFLKNDPSFFSSTLILFVINNASSSDQAVKDDNQKTIRLLRSILSSKNNGKLKEEIKQSGLQIGLIDASTKGRDPEDKHLGVGLARKIGMDAALTIFDYDIETKKSIICLDADCKIQPNYLTNVIQDFDSNGYNAAIVDYEHEIQGNREENEAVTCYEIFLRYYVSGLKYAGSGYAFHTIGSTIVCDHIAYIKSGGMNKRKAAEDFYFLEKLAKNYKINRISSTTIYPSNRSSWRVPFGTGQRVTRFLSKTQNEYLLFDPAVFDILKSWLKEYNSNHAILPKQVMNAAKDIHIELYNFLLEQEFEEQWERILSNTKCEKQFRYQKKIWFDGFKTLKLIHHLRDTAFPEINMFDALDEFFIKLKVKNAVKREVGTIPNISTQRKYLRLLRKIDNNILN